MKDLNPQQLTIAQAEQLHRLNKEVLSSEANTEKVLDRLERLEIRFEETERSLTCCKKELASTVRPSVGQTKKLLDLTIKCENLKVEIKGVRHAYDESSRESIAKRNSLNAFLKKHGLAKEQQSKAPVPLPPATHGFSSGAGASWAAQCELDAKHDAASGDNVNYTTEV